jgi:hypothetical protein
MQLPPQAFDPEAVALMGRVLDDALAKAQDRLSLPQTANPIELRNLVAGRVMAAVVVGQRNPERLRAIALEALDA